MTQEEALQAIKEKMDYYESDKRLRGAIETLIPELAESEDERIRKQLVDIVAFIPETNFKSASREDCRAYLEKQKINTEGDFGRGYDCGYQAGYAVAKNEMKSKVATATLDSEKQKEQIPYTDFVIKPHKGDDNNPYDMSASEAQEYAIKRGFGIPFTDGEVYVDERHMIQTIGNIIRWADEHPKPGEDSEYRKAYLDGWNARNLQVAREQKQEWSEEDEDIIRQIEWIASAAGCTQKLQEEIHDWFKSLKNRVNSPKSNTNSPWKPTEEHLSALLAIINDPNNIWSQTCQLALSDLYEHLKRLKKFEDNANEDNT